jgi:hypothetical protein
VGCVEVIGGIVSISEDFKSGLAALFPGRVSVHCVPWIGAVSGRTEVLPRPSFLFPQFSLVDPISP